MDDENEDGTAAGAASDNTGGGSGGGGIMLRERRRNLAAFWLLGLLNNLPYVILLAGATEISAGGVGLVFLADIAPTFVVKLTAPYWWVGLL